MTMYTFTAVDQTFTVDVDGYDPMDERGQAMTKANREFLDKLDSEGNNIYPGMWNGEGTTFKWLLGNYFD